MSESTPRSESAWGKPITIFSGALIVVVAIAAVAIAVMSGGDETQPTPSVSATPEGSAGSNSDSVCGLNSSDQSIPTTAAPETTWELVGTIAAPTSSDAGPGLDDEGFHSCFAQTPTGALFAAANIMVQGSDADLAERNVIENVAPGAGQEKALQATREALSEGSLGSVDERVQIAGFQVLEYTESAATIDLAVRSSNGVVASVVSQLVWLEGDWKIVLQENGQPAVPIRGLDSLAGYLLWSGA